MNTYTIPIGQKVVDIGPKKQKIQEVTMTAFGMVYRGSVAPTLERLPNGNYAFVLANELHGDVTILCRPFTLFERAKELFAK